MKHYEFHSALPPEQVFARLSVRTKKGKYVGGWQEAETFFSYRKEERIQLTYSGRWPANGFIPFSGTVCAEGAGSVISGGFSSWRTLWRAFAIAGSLALVIESLFGAPLWVSVPMVGLWLLFSWGFFTVIQPVFFQKRRKAILNFIQENLLE